jgi:hypothetical protein
MDGPDLKIPVHLSGLLWTTGSRSDGTKERGEKRLTSARFLATDGEVADRHSTVVMLR